MKKLCLFIFISFIAFPVLAQSEKGYVYLKNGTILKGKYEYFNNLEKIKIESAGNLWIFNATEVDSVSRFRANNQSIFEATNKEVKCFFRTEIGVLAGNSDNSQNAPFSFSTSLNYTINSNTSVGAGLGLEFLKETYLPAFINVEYKFRNSFATPYLFVKGGYQIPIEKSQMVYYDVYPYWSSSSIWPGPGYYNQDLDAKGGFLVNPGIGYQRMFSSGFGMSFAFGYQFHRLHFDGENDYRLDIDYNRLTIKLGIIFH
jgi:hypothetical protein